MAKPTRLECFAPAKLLGDAAIAAIAQIIAPIFGIVLLGWLAVRFKAIDEAATRGLSLFAFNVAIPVMLLRTLARGELPAQPEWELLLAYFASAFLVFGLAAGAARAVFRRKGAEPAIFGIGAAFSNIAILGIPVVLEAYGARAAVPLALLLACHSPLFFTLTTIAAEAGVGGALSGLGLLRNIARGLATNPILWGIAVGLGCNLLGLSLPGVLDRMAEILGAAALPAALFALGANLSRFRLLGGWREALTLAGLKIVLHPLLLWAFGSWVFDLERSTLHIAVTMAALPTGINAYLFAVRYRAAVLEVSSAILVSTLLSVGTLSLLLAVLHPG